MLRLIILFLLAIAFSLLIAKLFSKKPDNGVIDGESLKADTQPKRLNLLPLIFFGLILAGIVFFVLPRFGISIISLLQKVLGFLPLIRGFLPF